MNPSETRGDVTAFFYQMFNLRPPQAFDTDHLVHIGNTLLDENAEFLETLHQTHYWNRGRLREPILKSLIGTFQRLAEQYESDVTHQRLLVMWWKQLECARLIHFHPERREEAKRHLLCLIGWKSTYHQLRERPIYLRIDLFLFCLWKRSRQCKWTAAVQPPIESVDRAVSQAGSNEDESIESTPPKSPESDRAVNQVGSNEDVNQAGSNEESIESTSTESDCAVNQAGSNEDVNQAGSNESIESTSTESDRAVNQAGSNEDESIESTPPDRAASDDDSESSDDDSESNAEDPIRGAATAMGADGAEVGVSRKRAAENAPSASDPEQRGGKKARHAAKHAAARVERIEKSAEADDGGYALKAKGQAQREGVVFAVAKAGEEDRTCLADAVYALLRTLAVVVTKEAVRAALPATEQKDPDQKMAKQFALDHGVDLVHQPRLTGSPKSLLKETTGAFLIRLKITVADGTFDFHYVSFDAARALIIDNAPYVQFPEIGEEDLRDNRSAIRPFFHLFPKATDIRIASVLKGVA